MKNLLIIFGYLVSVIANCQIKTEVLSTGGAFIRYPDLSITSVMVQKEMPSFDFQSLIEEDEANKSKDIPFRFGKGFEVSFTIDDGNWYRKGEKAIWSLIILSKGAYSINLVLSDLNLPKGSELYLYNYEGSMVYGPIAADYNFKNGTFNTDIIKGDRIIIRIIGTYSSIPYTDIGIKKVIHGYRTIFPESAKSSGECNNDVRCFPAWEQESDAVSLVLVSGATALCTGCLLNNTLQDYRPFFLSAFHCVDSNFDGTLQSSEIDDAEDWSFRFSYKKTTCDGGTIGSYKTYNYSTYRSSWVTSDFVLLEISSGITTDTSLTRVGWDRTGNTPSEGVGIHHPSGDVMKISFDDESLSETSYYSNSGTNYWRVDWNDGVTEPGSSGSPLFDQNQRVIGQLRGGPSDCESEDLRDWYGCFYRSWTGGGSSTTRLSNWLDSQGYGNTTLNSVVIPYITGHSLVCYSPNKTFTLYNRIADSVYWTKSSNLYIVSGQNTDVLTVRATSSTTSGEGWVQANLYTDGIGPVIIRYENFWVGVPQPTITGEQYPGCGDINWYFLDPDDMWGSYSWSVTYRLSIVGSSVGHKASIRADEEGDAIIYCDVTNTCGTDHGSLQVWVGGCFDFKLLPNPADDFVEIQIDNSKTLSKDLNEFDIRLINIQNVTLIHERTSKFNTRFNTKELTPGIYFIQVIFNGKPYTKQLVISR